MAALSDQMLVVAMLTYLVAMMCYAAEWAFGDRGVVARVASRELVGATAGAAATDGTVAAAPGGTVAAGRAIVAVDEPPVDAPTAIPAIVERPSRALWAGRAAVVVTLVAIAVHGVSLVSRGLAAERVPWGNMYEFILAGTFIAAIGWVVVLVRAPTSRPVGMFVALTMVVLLGVDGLLLYTPVGPLVPALDSYWLVVHVISVVVASGVFLLGFVTAVLFLLRNGYENGKRGFPYWLAARIPAAPSLERLTFRLHAFAFPIWTFGALIAGPIWAEAAWGRYWGWDPKEVWAFISWVIYAGYLHARATPSVKRTTATWIAILGFLSMQMNLYGVNIFFEGLHSYGGV
jgi:cytochrome c-type biogenesis protein CcsB